jgi:hypothetical protein
LKVETRELMFLGEQITVPVGLNAETLDPIDEPAFAALVNPVATAKPTRKVEACISTRYYGGGKRVALSRQDDLKGKIRHIGQAFLPVLYTRRGRIWNDLLSKWDERHPHFRA